MKLNGWQRLWLSLSIAWVFIWGGYVVFDAMKKDLEINGLSYAGGFFFLGFGPPAAAYALGLLVAWIRRGFKADN